MTRWERKVKLRWLLSLRRLTSLGSPVEEREGRRWKEREGEQILSHPRCFVCMGGRRREVIVGEMAVTLCLTRLK